MTIGDIILPSRSPNLNQILFNGVKIDEFNNPKARKIIDKIADHILILSEFKSGNIEMTKKTILKTIPKLLFELIFTLFICKAKLMKVVSSYPLY